MQKWIVLATLAAASTLSAQLLGPLPPKVGSSPDVFGDASLWDSQLHHVTITGAADAPIAPLAAADGITMGGSAPLKIADMIAVRVIFFGESAGWRNDFGFTFGAPTAVSGPPSTASVAHASARTLVSDVDSDSPAPAPFAFWDIPVTAATFGSFDLWLNASSSFDASNPSPTTSGGLYHAFHSAWDNPAEAGSKASWSQSFILHTATFNFDANAVVVEPWETWLLTFEDLRNDTSDGDRSDLVLGLQIIRERGRTNSGVPEPGTYGVLGCAGLAMVVAATRQRRA